MRRLAGGRRRTGRHRAEAGRDSERHGAGKDAAAIGAVAGQGDIGRSDLGHDRLSLSVQ